MHGDIHIRGARTHNLKNIDLDIPRDKLVVITGLSGSGKSSLAFDTLYAEGQRRYVESLSAYARQFLDLMERPDVDLIEGLSPSIAIEQKAVNGNPRSTVGTITEIMDYLRLLFARAGTPYCPIHGLPLEVTPVSSMVDQILACPEESKIMVMAPVVRQGKMDFDHFFQDMQTQGFIRFKVDGKRYEAENLPRLDLRQHHDVDVIVDRLKVRAQARQRLAESIETALRLAQGRVIVEDMESGEKLSFSNHYCCPECGYSIEELEPRLFSFNNPVGACPVCNGMGESMVFTENSVVCHPELSLSSGAIHGWDRRNLYNFDLIEAVAKAVGFDPETPWNQLKRSEQEAILWGLGDKTIQMPYRRAGAVTYKTEPFEGVISILNRRYAETQNEAVKEELNRYRELKVCDACKGTRLKEAARHVFIGAGKHKKAIYEITAMPLSEARDYFKSLRITGSKQEVGKKLVTAIEQRLTFLTDVGLSYLTLDRRADTLSGGEAQRIRLASQIGSGLTGVMYVLDEPSIGLHQRDNDRLIETLKRLRDLGNSVIVVEHDEDTIRAADFVVDMGPLAGEAGGYVVASGTPKQITANPKSLTGLYLSGKKNMLPIGKPKRKTAEIFRLIGASGHNLKNVTLEIPVGLITVVSGVSGSGKSTLINDTLYRALAQKLYRASALPEPYEQMQGVEFFDKVINVDQSPIGRSPRSNPATYTGLFTPIRDLFAQTPTARERGYDAGRFSFNVKGGRCENCQGEGFIKVEMNFLPDMYVPCEHCHGQRYNRETLEVLYKGLNIAQVLELTVKEAREIFSAHPIISRKLDTLIDVGLGYVKLGQSALTLSGGEAQRMKLALELSRKDTSKTLYILDEPTTGLHFEDVKMLIEVIKKLRDAGNTVVIIEHNLDVIASADWVVDMGPDGGEAGGEIIASGTPSQIMKNKNSVTGVYLKKHIEALKEFKS
ncbi:MAG TPA: excinuclease ABC subunit UvrA [Candidatus Aphodousia faecigallinarum]|uniref:UvrABC system protein A n=1 Tax=Candidatus Aphodousia faecigallinarum TaxID=2840677 RepID=A0A9D1IL24_9BURK|nr:excinuclease ABC subunit UvrA [Candidatus Aphodousia faecigallinarum]